MNKVKNIALWCSIKKEDYHFYKGYHCCQCSCGNMPKNNQENQQESQDPLKDFENNMLLHVNYWHFPNGKKKEGTPELPDILDIGLMIPFTDKLEKISLYLPFCIKSSDIEDISHLLKTKEVAGAIFNESIIIREELHDASHFFLEGNQLNCRVRPFYKENENENTPFDCVHLDNIDIIDGEREKGTIISICENHSNTIFAYNLKENEEGKPTYFRLRISLSKKNKTTFVKEIKPLDSFINSGYETTEFIDFRINEFRLLPRTIQDRIIAQQSKTYIPVKRIDFLLAVNLDADITGATKEFHKLRFLEPNVWKKYLEGKHHFIEDGMIVYHWKKSREINQDKINDFTAFVKFKTRVSNRLVFFVLSIIIGIIASLITTFLTIKFIPQTGNNDIIQQLDKRYQQIAPEIKPEQDTQQYDQNNNNQSSK